VNPQTQHLIFNVFTSICHHYDYLYDNLLHNCTFQEASTFFKDIPEDFHQNTRVSYPWNKMACSPKATGIPPLVMLMADMEELKAKFDKLELTIIKNMKEEF
jgi:hypothetical protein